MRRGLEVLREYKRLAGAQGAEKILAVATSAIREAANGEDFLRRVGREIRIWPRAITGETEARLIYLAALHSIHLEGQRALVVDIGGGSVELALGAGSHLRWAVSEKLGVLRMSQRFVRSDPISRGDGQRLADHVGETVAPHVDRIAAEGGSDRVIGTSGTMTCGASIPGRSSSSPTSPATTAGGTHVGSTPHSPPCPVPHVEWCGCWPAASGWPTSSIARTGRSCGAWS